MSHILKKLQVAGARKKKKPKPPIYKPPAMGELQYGASYSYAETLDLISDGPIEGLVGPLGERLEGLNILKGIYLDDTPIAISNDITASADAVLSETEEVAQQSRAMEVASVGVASGTKSFRNFFRAITQQPSLSTDGLLSAMTSAPDSGGYDPYEWRRLPDITFMNWRIRRKGNNPEHAPHSYEAAIQVRALIHDAISTQDFYWYLDGEQNTEAGASSSGRIPVYRNDHFPRGIFNHQTHKCGRPQSLFWTDQNTLAASKFFMGFGNGKVVWNGQFSRTNEYSEDLVRPELEKILALWNDNNETLNPDANLYQRELAAKALTNLGWDGEQSNLAGLLSRKLYSPCWLHGVIMVGDEDVTALNQNILDPNGPVTTSETIRDADGNLKEWLSLLPMQTVLYGATHGWNLESHLNSLWGWKNSYPSKVDVTCPEVDAEGNLTGKIHGFILFQFYENYSGDKRGPNHCMYAYTIPFEHEIASALADLASLQYTHVLGATVAPASETQVTSDLKFNYSNVLAEVNKGEEDQEPLNYFKNIFIDHVYNKELFGPFSVIPTVGDTRTKGVQKYGPQRIHPDVDMLTRSEVLAKGADHFNLEMDLGNNLPIDEGSDDKRYSVGDKYYSRWGANSLVSWNEQALSTTHTVYNPNVTKAFITLNLQALSDTLVKKVDNVGGDPYVDFEVGTKFPTVINIRVETGTQGDYKNGAKGGEDIYQTYNYRIVALIEGPTLIDIGNPDLTAGPSNRDFIVSLDEERTNLNVPFELPPVNIIDLEEMDVEGRFGIEAGTIDQDSVKKRFIRVTKLSYESNSVLIKKIANLNKVTEIIEADMPYPFSAIVATKLDSRAFGAIPNRNFDCKLKKVKIPNNYFPAVDGLDRRYYQTIDQFNGTSKAGKLVYDGDWNGQFHDELMWTDNPAWILYDLLTNKRYGMGSHIDTSKINKWQLYKIGRFCDAVDDSGYFEGVTDGRGGLEPRFSCNLVFNQGQKIYDAINTITQIFRGRAFFGNSEINFVDDRPRAPINLFTNESVKDGQFFYSNNRRDQQYNTIEVGFKDRFDNFAPKIEVIEDEDDIKERGIFKTKIEAVGITSRAMARRVGQHHLFHSIDENQTVAFTAGLESLLCQPGDLVTIEDELKTNKANFGKVLAVDLDAETIRLSNTWNSVQMNEGTLTVYNPTGRDTIEYTDQFNDILRDRYESFTITGFGTPLWVRYTGDYQFSGYTTGYSVSVLDDDPRSQQYGLYTGTGGTFLYFEAGVTGWTFASGTGAGNVGAFDLASGDFIQEITGARDLFDFNTGKIAPMVMTGTKRESAGVTFSGLDTESLVGPYKGVLNSEIAEASPDQMAVLNVTGTIIYDNAQLQSLGFNPYGTVVSGFDKPQLLPFVKLGSAAKFEIKDASPFIYKVIAMKEEAPNQYLVSATKYDTGKFNLIEKNISIENQANTLSFQTAQTINGIQYSTLDPPFIDSLTTGVPAPATDTFTITGMWTDVAEGTGFNVRLTQPNGSVEQAFVTTTGHEFEGLGQVGVYNFCVNALGNKGGDAQVNATFDSSYDCSGIFVVYDELLLFNRSFVDQITIL